MPSPIKRSQRTRRARDVSPSRTVAEQSSPSRPTKRRRKLEDPPSEPIEDEGSSLTIDPNHPETTDDDDGIIAQVTQHLRSIPTQAAEIHANTKHDASSDIQAYAKIAASDWTYYIKALSINIGRTSDPLDEKSEKSIATNASKASKKDRVDIDIDIGPSKTFSRQTATIYYDSDLESWFVSARGRNGLKIDNEVLKKSDPPHALVSGEVIDIGGLEMMFVLPGNIGRLRISSIYLEQAGLPVPDDERRAVLPRPRPTNNTSSSQPPTNHPSSSGQTFRQPIAPAPPDYRRPGTPPSTRSHAAALQAKTPAQTSSHTVVMSQTDVDLSVDENRHIKPPFSYAQMISQGIMSVPEEKLSLTNIYNYITTNYSYYRHQPIAGWQNSIRHNLSLNKQFTKAPRSTDEPGKGMKWLIVAEFREEMIKNAWKGGRGGHRGSSVPSSPSQPSQPTYINQGPKDMAKREAGSSRKRKASPLVTSPMRKPTQKLSHVTPDRRPRHNGPSDFQNGSPVPRSRKGLQPSSSFAEPSEELSRSPPTLTSSYLQDEGASFVTPAPNRVHPRLAPPSTAQRPSQHMPTSSPAPFWKFADINSTPMRPGVSYDMSPLKPLNLPNSSSPVPGPADDLSPVASPTRSRRGATQERRTASVEDDDEDGGFDLTKGFQSIGSYHAPPPALGSLAARANGGHA